MGWDGVQAQLKGVELNTVPLYGSCVPDYYTPVIIAGETTLAERPTWCGASQGHRARLCLCGQQSGRGG